MSDHLKITPDDSHNPLWHKIEAQLKNRLASLRSQLEGPKELDETNRIRGGIAEVKLMLNAAAEKPYVPPHVPD
jgi:hypothetical protein